LAAGQGDLPALSRIVERKVSDLLERQVDSDPDFVGSQTFEAHSWGGLDAQAFDLGWTNHLGRRSVWITTDLRQVRQRERLLVGQDLGNVVGVLDVELRGLGLDGLDAG